MSLSPTASGEATEAHRALDVNAANLALGHGVFEAEGATFVRSRAYPRIHDANHVRDVTASSPEAIDRLLVRVERDYEDIGHRRFDVDFRTPPGFVARLALEGYERSDALAMLVEGEVQGKRSEHEIRAIETDEDWAEYARLRTLDWREYSERSKRPDEPEVGEALIAISRLKSPPVRYWLACVEGKPRAYMNSWVGLDGMGQIEDLFTEAEFRHRGLASALIHHCVADCRAQGAGPVVIVADPTDTPRQMYAAMGFRPVAVYSHYLKLLDAGGSSSGQA